MELYFRTLLRRTHRKLLEREIITPFEAMMQSIEDYMQIAEYAERDLYLKLEAQCLSLLNVWCTT